MQHLQKTGGVHPSSQKPISLPKLFSSAPYLVTSLRPYFARRSWRGRMLGQRAKREGQLTRDERRLSDYFDEVASGALLRKQGEDGLIHSGEIAMLVHGKPKQVGIGDLMPHQPAGKRLGGRNKTDFVCPETMSGMIQIGAENFQCFRWCYGVAGERRVGNNSDESRLREWASSPSLVRFPAEPILRLQMAFMGGPHQCDEHVDVEQEGAHFWSASSSRTFFMLTRGDSGGRSKTCTPFTKRVGRGTVNARRTNSDTALPRASERLAA